LSVKLGEAVSLKVVCVICGIYLLFIILSKLIGYENFNRSFVTPLKSLCSQHIFIQNQSRKPATENSANHFRITRICV